MARETPFFVRRLKRFLKSLPLWGKWCWGITIGVFYCAIVYIYLVAPTGFRWRAIYGEPNYPKGYNIRGIDVSRYQGNINWNRLRNALIDATPVRFIFIKSTQGDSYIDPKFRSNFFEAKENGFLRGVYHFWSNKVSARRQAYFFLAMVKLQPGDFPPVLDVENKPKDMTTEDFQQNILTWLHIVEDRYHVKPLIYTYYKFKQQYLSDQRFDDYPYWIAHYYVNQMEYKGRWKIWQHTDAGKLPGIKGYVDLNIYNGSYYDMQQMLIPEPAPIDSSAISDSTSYDSLGVQSPRDSA